MDLLTVTVIGKLDGWGTQEREGGLDWNDPVVLTDSFRRRSVSEEG
jgi:hypothetical protein